MNSLPCQEEGKTAEKECTCPETCWIERPKFSGGQMLTDADLTSGVNYVIKKNNLHNRYLHGWGVVCGLKVKCFPCCTGHGSSGKVVVESGYAIDCCGNDLVVCDEREFDVIGRIDELKKKKKTEADPCAPAAVPETPPCQKAEEKYYLTISYREEDAKPTTLLKSKDGCSVQSCVPTRTSECYQLDLIEYCTLEKKAEDTLITRLKKCIEIFNATWEKVFDGEFQSSDFARRTPEEIKYFAREYHKAVRDHVRCDILDELDAVEVTDEEGYDEAGNVATHATPAKVQLLLLILNLLLDCICQAFLNPCPECTEDDVVILATITVKNRKIDRICNFSRKWVMTFPTLFYWLPVNTWVGNAVKSLCCELDLRRPGSLPLWVYAARLVEQDLMFPRMFAQGLSGSMKAFHDSFTAILDPENVSLERAINKDASEAEDMLEEMKIEVVRTERYIPSIQDVSLENLFSSIPVARPGSKVVQLVDEENRVVGFRTYVPEDVRPVQPDITRLKEELDEIKAVMPTLKRDTGSVIRGNLAIAEDYRRESTVELTRGLLREMELGALEGVGSTRANKLRKAKVESPLDVLEGVPADISDALGEPMRNAYKYINNAEELTLATARCVAGELEKEKIKKKKDWDEAKAKRITKRIATKLNVPAKRVSDVITEVRKGG
jgi:hypothetical protein